MATWCPNCDGHDPSTIGLTERWCFNLGIWYAVLFFWSCLILLGCLQRSPATGILSCLWANILLQLAPRSVQFFLFLLSGISLYCSLVPIDNFSHLSRDNPTPKRHLAGPIHLHYTWLVPSWFASVHLDQCNDEVSCSIGFLLYTCQILSLDIWVLHLLGIWTIDFHHHTQDASTSCHLWVQYESCLLGNDNSNQDNKPSLCLRDPVDAKLVVPRIHVIQLRSISVTIGLVILRSKINGLGSQNGPMITLKFCTSVQNFDLLWISGNYPIRRFYTGRFCPVPLSALRSSALGEWGFVYIWHHYLKCAGDLLFIFSVLTFW